VLHGFYFREPGTFMVGVTCYFDRGDDLECRWDDPALEFDWPETPRHLSERDANAPGLDALLEDLAPYQPF
jgi:dTDP-4-dehydrorhamnose 3,5-epimerase-like enzyme